MILAMVTGQPFTHIVEMWHGRDVDTAWQLLADARAQAEAEEEQRQRERRFAEATQALFAKGW